MAPHKKPWRKLIQISETKRNVQEDTEVSIRDKEMFKMTLIETGRCTVTKIIPFFIFYRWVGVVIRFNHRVFG